MKLKLLAALIMTGMILGCETAPVQDTTTDANQGATDATAGGLNAQSGSGGTEIGRAHV